jgi:signal peptide peptidase SppA
MITEEDIWFGSLKSLRDLENMIQYMDPGSFPAKLKSSEDDEYDYNPVVMQELGSVAVLNITGPLISKSTFWSQVLGVISYEDIKARLAQVGDDKKIKSVLMNFDSPGGDAKGCKLCARYIRDFSDNVKPVVGYTEGYAASAAYWLYAATGARAVDEEGRLGSVGAIMVHTEYTEMDRKQGITRRVFRSAPYKALGTPYEKLSEDAENQIREELDHMHNLFVSGISELMDLDREEVSSTIANGKMFRAKQALKLGMADHQLSLEETVAKLAAGSKKLSASDTTTKR